MPLRALVPNFKGKRMTFKRNSVASLAALSALVSGCAFASAQDDATWIAQCVADNKDEGASRAVVQYYCECMNDKMSEDEMQSITQWETTHPQAMHACERAAGWK